MTIVELGALGELVGGVAVIGSLLYVGLQVRQNTVSVQGANSQAVSDSALRYVSLVAGSPQVALTLNRGLAGEVLDPGEQAQFTYLFHGWARQTEQCFYLYRKGVLDEELWHGLLETSRAYVGSEGGRRMWPSIRPRLRATFLEYMEREVVPTAGAEHARNFLDPTSN